MSVWGAFLRGINLGKRQMKMAELKACLEADGFAEVKTILASGNVRLAADGTPDAIKARLEKAIAAQFGFEVGVVLRSEEELETMLREHPFGTLDPDADLTRHVILFDKPLPRDISLESRPGDTEILRVDPREVYFAGYRQANGRYTEHVEEVLKPLYAKLGKGNLDTMRNWNTIEKILK
ncbi:Uncharacterized conserved protein, DUF1697 family [Devosia lucknowensis]|uniref:Uncharacterized conserved protein, DUF1697 family n=1 Tax=Devosia lucknowensis TaxID=1096929 RepID=A0A1Y6G6I2_9HYPH|nr:DUF1697 domain-containing protein [Devosia lucknowensis]SMQ85755.1 Uncharacterized conserved protein, DUF1697 family [Devosia lucknowensis]